MTTLPLDSRQARIARMLLDGSGVVSLEQVAADLRLTQRIVRYNLGSIDAFLARSGLRLVRRRGVGIWVDGDPIVRAAVRDSLDAERGPAVLDATDRQGQVLLALLLAAPDAVRSESLEAGSGVSRPTVRRDVRAAEGWIEQHRLHLRRLPGVGLAVRGSEVDVRAGLLSLVLETVPEQFLLSAATTPDPSRTSDQGLQAFVAHLDLPAFRAILARELRAVDDRDATMLTATLSVALLAERVRTGHPARLVRGRLRSLTDHPVYDAARRIARAIQARTGTVLAPAEVASITEALLGFVELTDPRAAPDDDLMALVDRLVASAAARLHPSLAEDDLLRANLTEHVRRLNVRLKYGLPVSNPLQHEVRKRYPDVYAAATGILAEVGSLEGTDIPSEEIGFLTMYLAGSLERHRLRPKVRVTVVCPAGMATAWILVSRLLAEFPQLEIAQVVSKAVFEDEPVAVSTDLIVSTVPLDEFAGRIPSLVVSPLLQERDVRRLNRLLDLPLERSAPADTAGTARH